MNNNELPLTLKQTDARSADSHHPDATGVDTAHGDSSVAGDAGVATGTMSWTSNGTSFSEPISLGLNPFTVVGTSTTIAVFQTSATTSDYQNSIQFSVYGAIPSTTIPAGTYNCAGGNPHVTMMTSSLATASAQATSSNGGTCSVTFDNEATNGGTVTGTFSGELIGVSGAANQSITNGSFTVSDRL